MRLTVIGEPIPQGSKTRWGSEDNPRTAPWRATVAAAAAAANPAGELWALPLELRVVFVFPRPKSHYGTGRNANVLKPSAPALYKVSKPDGDKLMRAIGDSLTGTLVRDDAYIVTGIYATVYGAPARAEIEIVAADHLPLELEELLNG